tara:strand:- start:164 stop:646 length:483 start_codon:yes stop_codon:yes gene_type:complete
MELVALNISTDMAIVLKSKSSKVSRIYDDQVIEAVKSYTFTAKKDFGTCDISSKKISKGDKCEMLILEDGTKVTTLLSTTIAKGKKAGKVQSTSIPSKKVAKPIAKAIKKTTAKAVKETYSNEVIQAVFLITIAKDDAAKYKVLMSLPIDVMTQVITLTK